MKKVAIIGQGYVGLTIASFATKHHQVIGFDSNQALVDQLNSGVSHIEGVESLDIRSAISNGNYWATTSGTDIVDSDIVIIAVPTPLDNNRQPDLTYIEAACKTIAENMSHQVLGIHESTSFPVTIRDV